MSSFCICLWDLKHIRILSIPWLWIWHGSEFPTQGLPIFVNMTVLWIYVSTQLCKSPQYSRNPIMLDFCLCKHYTRYWISLNMAGQFLNKPFWPFWLWQGSDCARSKFHRVFNKSPVLNMPWLGIWYGCEYASVTKGAEYA